jgi:hypothetical protein
LEPGEKGQGVIFTPAWLPVCILTARLVARDIGAWQSQLPVSFGEAYHKFASAILDLAASLRVGNGLVPGVEMGPVIFSGEQTRIEGSIAIGVGSGSQVLLDGRETQPHNGDHGNFLRPTVVTVLGQTTHRQPPKYLPLCSR